MEHFLRDKSFKNNQDLQNQLDAYFEAKPKSFYRDGIRQLVTKWQKVIDSQGNYFDDERLLNFNYI